ncbi:hypothetical protein VNO77_26983 [Canavalia gladiata]|uniref:Uncharacterized protein n=1 Tax=Canavalia gladiata TaxID=3824 RepID=A0AAN9KUJ5_CANGL
MVTLNSTLRNDQELVCPQDLNHTLIKCNRDLAIHFILMPGVFGVFCWGFSEFERLLSKEALSSRGKTLDALKRRPEELCEIREALINPSNLHNTTAKGGTENLTFGVYRISINGIGGRGVVNLEPRTSRPEMLLGFILVSEDRRWSAKKLVGNRPCAASHVVRGPSLVVISTSSEPTVVIGNRRRRQEGHAEGSCSPSKYYTFRTDLVGAKREGPIAPILAPTPYSGLEQKYKPLIRIEKPVELRRSLLDET